MTSDYVASSSVLQAARERGYLISEDRTTPKLDLAQSIFEAATQVALKTRPRIIHLVCNFLLPDPLKSARVAWLLDQLWVAQKFDHGTRLLALTIDVEPGLSKEDEQRDRGLATMGYETYHAAGWWMLIDPQRVIYEFMQAANITVTRQRPRQYPGSTINDYLCASPSCRRPMISDEFGYGIAFHKGLGVHDECYDRVINEDELGWVPYNEDRLS
jgi:hypothetical protein